MRHKRIKNDLIECAVEVATAIKRAIGNSQRLGQFLGERRADFFNQSCHFGIGLNEVRKNGQELVAEIADLAVANIKIEHAQKLGIAACIRNQRFAAGILNNDRCRHAIVRVTTKNGIKAANARSQLDIDIHTIMRKQNDNLGPFLPDLVNNALQLAFLNAKSPVGHHVARIGNGCIREGLTNDSHLHAVLLTQGIGRENRVTEIQGFHVLGNKVYFSIEIFFYDFLDAIHAQRELPMPCHDVDAQSQGGIHHVLTIGPKGRA